MEKPVTEGQLINLTITSIGRKGDGVGKHEEFIIVVPTAKLGKEYQVKITNVHNSYAFGVIHNEL